VEELVQRNLMTADQTLQTALQLHQAGRLDEAESSYRTVLAATPQQADAQHLLGALLLQRGRNEEAMEHLQRAIALRPKEPIYQINLALALMACQKIPEAAAACDRAFALQPPDADVQARLASAYARLALGLHQKGEDRLAAAAQHQARQISSDFNRATMDMCAAMRGKGRMREALEILQRAAARLPNYFDAHNLTGMTLVDLDRRAESIPYFRRAVQLRPDSARPHLSLGGNLWSGDGSIEEAVAQLRQAIQIEPEMPVILNALAHVLGNLGELNEVAQLHARMAALRPKQSTKAASPQARDVYVVCSIRNGGLDLLPHWLEHYSRLKPDQILLGIFDDVSMENRAEIQNYSRRWRFQTFAQKFLGVPEEQQEKQRRDALRAAGAAGDSWIVYTDLDEFHTFPAPLAEIAAAAETRGVEVIFGWMLDRVAADGSFPEIPVHDNPDAGSLWDVFPFGCRLTGPILRGSAKKVMMARLSHEVTIGHHQAGEALAYPIPLGQIGDYVVHHFKWHKDVIARLEWGLAHATAAPGWQDEARRFIAWLTKNDGRINLSDPAISAIHIHR
jgi:tetratricopeptide (TPR) repeat protein